MGKRLYKSNNKMLAGVCGGFAEYFKIDPTIVRIGWVVISLLTGIWVGAIAYVACGIIIPNRPSSEEGWDENLKSANDYSSAEDKEFNSHFEEDAKRVKKENKD